MCSVCVPRFETRYQEYCAARRKRRKRKVVRFAKTIDVINLSVMGSRRIVEKEVKKWKKDVNLCLL